MQKGNLPSVQIKQLPYQKMKSKNNIYTQIILLYIFNNSSMERILFRENAKSLNKKEITMEKYFNCKNIF